MSWGKIDDRMPEHRKWAALERSAGARVWADAMATWVAVLCYANRNESDGCIETVQLERLTPIGKAAVRAAEAMVEARLMERTEHGYRLYAFTEYNPSRADKQEAREADKRRKAEGKPPGRPKGFRAESERNAPGFQRDSDRIPKYPDPDPIPSPSRSPEGERPPSLENRVRSKVAEALKAAGRPAPPLDTSSKCARVAEWCDDHAKATGRTFDDVLDALARGFASAAGRTAKAGWPMAFLVANPGEYIRLAPSNPALGGGETDEQLLADLRRTA